MGGPATPACTLSNTEINNLLRERVECNIARDYKRANRIMYDLRVAGVILNDRLNEWRADGLYNNYKEWEDGETLESCAISLSALQCIDDAREKVQELLLDFMEIIDDAGAKGRLTYEVASSCAGRHNPTDSTSNAVGWRGPNGSGFLSLIELPFVYIDGRKSFHAHMVTQTLENSHCVNRLGCLIKVFGDDFGVPLKYCDPYALVSGASWQAVDEAVEIVRDAIEEHMRICRCTYSPQQQTPQPQPPLLPLPPTTAVNMKLPVWIQSDCSSQRDLFCKTVS